MQANSPGTAEEPALDENEAVHPLSTEQATVLADGLLAIADHVQNHPEAKEHCFDYWLSWLDDGGYNKAGFSEALHTLCQRLLSSDDYKQLVALAREKAKSLNGYPSAIDYLSQHHSALLDQILVIERSRQEEIKSINAMAGGLSKKAKIGLIAGAVYVGVAVVGGVGGTVGYLRAKAREEAKDLLVNEAHDLLVNQAQDPLDRVLDMPFLNREMQGINGRPIEEIIAETTLRHEVPLSLQSDAQFDKTVDSVFNQLNSVHWFPSKSSFTSEIFTKALRSKSSLYLDQFNEWLRLVQNEASTDITTATSNLKENVLSSASEKYGSIKDIDNDLLHQFESSDFAMTFWKDVAAGKFQSFAENGGGFFFRAVKQKIRDHFSSLRIRLNEAASKGELTQEEEYLNNHVDFDYSQGYIRTLFAGSENSALTELISGKFLTMDGAISESFDKIFNENPFVHRARQLLRSDIGSELKLALRRAITKIENEQLLQKFYSKDRNEIDTLIKNQVDTEAKKVLQTQFDHMGFLDEWMNNRVVKTEQEISALLKSDACRAFRSALADAEAAAKAIDQDSKAFERDL